MTVYIVGESLECEEANIRVFSTKEKAKEFIINSYEKFINHPKNIELAKNWSLTAWCCTTFAQGIYRSHTKALRIGRCQHRV